MNNELLKYWKKCVAYARQQTGNQKKVGQHLAGCPAQVDPARHWAECTCQDVR